MNAAQSGGHTGGGGGLSKKSSQMEVNKSIGVFPRETANKLHKVETQINWHLIFR